MQRIIHPPALPGCCYFCGSAEREWFIDTTLSVEFHGAMYICCTCAAEIGHIAGMATPEEVDSLRTYLAEIKQHLEEQMIRNEGLEQALDGLRLAGSVSRTYSEPTSDVDSFDEPEGSAEPATDLGEGTREPSESVHDEGMAVVSNDGGAEPESFQFNL